MAIKLKLTQEKSVIGYVFKLKVTQTLTKETPRKIVFKYFDTRKDALDFSNNKILINELIKESA